MIDKTLTNKTDAGKILLNALIAIGSIALLFWIFYNPVRHYHVHLAGMDNRPDSNATAMQIVNIGENFEQLGQTESTTSGSWTRFRGADFDNISKDQTPLLDKFPDGGPQILWEKELGEGHSAPVIQNGKVYILDYEEEEKADALRCFDLKTGTELWKRSYKVHIKRNHGMSRTTPAINQNYLITIGPLGHAMCVDPENGDFLWGIDMVADYGSEIPFWYTGQCPLLEDDLAILAPAGSKLLVAVNCKTGEIVWETPNPLNWQMSHSSIMPMEFAGQKMYVYAAIGGIAGIAAGGDNPGEILWQNTDFDPSVVAPSPLILPNGKIFMTAGYGAGAAVYQLHENNGKISAETRTTYKPKDGLASEQQTPIYAHGMVYGILPKDAGSQRNQLVCCHPDDFTTFVWTSDKTHRYGLGPYLLADNKLFIVDDDGTLTINKISPNGFSELDKYRVIEGQDAWGPIALADGYFIMRDSKKMLCLNMKK